MVSALIVGLRSGHHEYIQYGHYPPGHTMEFNKETMSLVAGRTTVAMLNVDNNIWFKGNDCASALSYKDPKRAIKRHVDPEWQQTLETLLQKGSTPDTHLEKYTLNDLSARWVSEPGLYDLASSSKLPAAKAFKKWVFGEVLPSIRKTGSYAVQAAAPAANQENTWLDKRVEGKELMRLKNASLQELIAGAFGRIGPKLFAIAGNLVNQSVLGFTQTTTNFKKQQQLPRGISIPDILNMQGQVAGCYAETCFQKFVSDNLQRLMGLPEADLIKEFTQLKLDLRHGFVAIGMGDLQSKTLTVPEAKKRKAEIEFKSRKQQKLLQTEQPRLIECAA